MRAPAYWYNPPDHPGLRARLLAPLGAVRARVVARQAAVHEGWRAPVPIVCIGTLAAGDDGHAALEAMVAHLLRGGHAPAILIKNTSRARRVGGPRRVDPRRDGPSDADPAALIAAALAPTWTYWDRASGARAILAARDAGLVRVDCIVVQGGLRDPALVKDLALAVVDTARGFGNGRCIPAGPLFEPVRAGLGRVDLMLSIGSRPAQERFVTAWGDVITAPHLRGTLRPLETGMDWSGTRVLSFAGPGQCHAMTSALRAFGAEVLRSVTLDDRTPISGALLARLQREAAIRGAQLVTTEKVAVGLPSEHKAGLLTLPLRLVLEQTALLKTALSRVGLADAR